LSGHGAFGDVADFRNSRDAVTIDFACEPDRDDTGTIVRAEFSARYSSIFPKPPNTARRIFATKSS